MKRLLLIFCFVFCSAILGIQAQEKTDLVYKIDIRENIMPGTWLIVKRGFNEADSLNADMILIHMNTYGGLVDAADSIRTRILNYPKPVVVFIDNNAASAGALISISCDKIYMRPGGNIGAATVVTQSGEQAPDKYQAYMRSTMRATAEAHGKDTLIQDNDTIISWKRNPLIAEAMVDDRCVIPGIIDSGKVITFTAQEAIENGYCDGLAESITDVIKGEGIQNYEIISYEPSLLDSMLGILTNPILQGILIMLIVAGLYFELQTPGIGFPLAAAILAAILYFAPLYLEGLAENWEIVVFIVGLALLALEIFVIPGFGVAGITGIIVMVAGLTLSLIENVAFDFSGVNVDNAFRSLAIVVVSMLISFVASIWAGSKLLTGTPFKAFVLSSSKKIEEGYVGVDSSYGDLIGQTGVSATDLRPSGKVELDNEMYDSTAISGYIDKGVNVMVIKYEAGQLYVRKV